MKNATALLIIMTTFMVIHAHPEAVKLPELIVQLGNPSGRPGEIISLAVSPDGKYALAGSRDNSITLYHIPSGNEIRRLTGTGAINTLSFSPDGKYILSGSTSFSNILKKDIPTLVLWDTSTGQQIKVFQDFPAGIHALAFSSDGRFMISGGSDYTVKLWEVDPGKKLKQFNGHTGTIRALSFSPDDKFILSGAIGGEVKLWDIETGREIKQYNGFSKNISVVAFTSDGKRVIAGCETGLKSWEISSAEESNIFKKLSHKIPHGGISSNGRFILAESGCGEVTILDTFNEQAKHTIKFSAECNKIKAAAVDPGGANILLYSGNRLYYLDTKTNIEINSIKKYSSQINFSIFSPDGNYILVGSSDNTLKLWDLEKGTQIRELSGHKDKVICGAFSSEGNLAVSGSTDKTVKLWDIHGGQQIKTLEGHSDDIFFVAFSPDGKQVFSASADNTFKVWDFKSGKNIKTLKQDYHFIDSAAVSPDGKKALIGTSALSFPLRMVDIKTGKVVKSLNGHYDLVYSISITPDGNYVVTLSKDETAKLWNLNTGNEIKTTHPLAWFFSMTALSPDGSYILTTNKKDILLIETSTGKVIKKLRGHSGFVSSVAFCLNGKYALSGSEDKTVRLWHLKSGKEVECLRNDMGDVVSITVSLNGNGKNALFMNYDQEVQLWDIEKKHRLKCFAEAIDDLKYVGFSPDERYLLWGKNDDILTIWDIKGKRILRTFHGRFPTFLSTSNIITPDGKAILLGNGENGVNCFDILTGKQMKGYKEFGSDILAIDIAKHGNLFIAGSSDNINIWDMNSETPASSYNWVAGDGNFINTFVITPCGRYYLIPVPFFGGTMSLWDIGKARIIKRLWEQKEVASTVTFSRDGKLAVTESGGLLADSKLRIWDIENARQVITLSTKSGEALEELDTGKTDNPLGIDIPIQDKFHLIMNLAKRLKTINTKELYGHAVFPQSTAISPEGRYVLTGSGANFLGQNYTLKLWDLKSRCLSKTLSGHTNRITAIAFSPDGSKALSADKIGTVRLWDIPSGKLLATLISLKSGKWCALTPDGRYTSNSPGDLEGVSWRMPDSPMIPLPIEIFMREYYEPRLLPRIFSGAVFPPITDIKSLNRIQPDVKIVSIEPVKNRRARLNVTEEIKKGNLPGFKKGNNSRSTPIWVADKNKNSPKTIYTFQRPSLFNFTKSKREITLISLKEK
jgi:WD40 repeat protein